MLRMEFLVAKVNLHLAIAVCIYGKSFGSSGPGNLFDKLLFVHIRYSFCHAALSVYGSFGPENSSPLPVLTHSAPAGAVMLAASSVDAMLKEKGYNEGSLYARIGQARDDHLITADMAEWAHEVRLDANDQRHADEAAALPCYW